MWAPPARRAGYQWVGWAVGVVDGLAEGLIEGLAVAVLVGVTVMTGDGLLDGAMVGVGTELAVLVGITMAGLLVMVGVGAAGAVAEPPVVAKLVMLVHSIGRKYSVGDPLARIWFMPPRCRLRYQAPGPGTLLTPVTTRVWLTMFPPASATKSASMYLTGPWLWQLPRWMCAACAPGVRPDAVTETARV